MTSVTDLAAAVEAAARHHPDGIFLRTPAGLELTYARLVRQSGRCITALRARGVMPGDRVVVQADKSADVLVLYVACLRMGAVFVPINAANTPNEFDYFVRDSQPRLAVVRPQDQAQLRTLAAAAGVAYIETLGSAGDGSFPQLVGECAETQASRPGGSNAVAAIVYTSGTTGRSKGAMLTHGNLTSNAAALAQAWRFTAGDVLLHSLPLFHVHGLFAAVNTVLASRSSLVLLPKFDAATVMSLLPAATVYMGVPTHYTRLLLESSLDRKATAAIRLFVSGSAPLLAETHREFFARTGHMILERYGMTETLMNTSNPYEGARVPGSVGLALPGVAVRVADGSVEIQGPNVFAGYWQDPVKTAGEFTADGWFKTGDLGRIDGDGYVYIVGRAKDLVISGGYNVYPLEVEMELNCIAGVSESAVFGVPHPDFGEGVTAAVVRMQDAELSEAGIIGALKARLAGYKIPKHIVFVAELPRNPMGKVQKNRLRAAYSALYRAV